MWNDDDDDMAAKKRSRTAQDNMVSRVRPTGIKFRAYSPSGELRNHRGSHNTRCALRHDDVINERRAADGTLWYIA